MQKTNKPSSLLSLVFAAVISVATFSACNNEGAKTEAPVDSVTTPAPATTDSTGKDSIPPAVDSGAVTRPDGGTTGGAH